MRPSRGSLWNHQVPPESSGLLRCGRGDGVHTARGEQEPPLHGDAGPLLRIASGAEGLTHPHKKMGTWREVEREAGWSRQAEASEAWGRVPSPRPRLPARRQLLLCSHPAGGGSELILGLRICAKRGKSSPTSFPRGLSWAGCPGPGRPGLQLRGSCRADRPTAGPARPPPGWASFRRALLYWKGGSRGQEAPGQPAPAPAKRQGGFSMWGAKPKLWAPFSCKSKTENLEGISCQCGPRSQAAPTQGTSLGVGLGMGPSVRPTLGIPSPESRLGELGSPRAEGAPGMTGRQGDPERHRARSRCPDTVAPWAVPCGDSLFPSHHRTELPRAEVFMNSVHPGVARGVSASSTRPSTRATPLKSTPQCGLLDKDLQGAWARCPWRQPPPTPASPSLPCEQEPSSPPGRLCRKWLV